MAAQRRAAQAPAFNVGHSWPTKKIGKKAGYSISEPISLKAQV
jgi:hypothetical protein